MTTATPQPLPRPNIAPAYLYTHGERVTVVRNRSLDEKAGEGVGKTHKVPARITEDVPIDASPNYMVSCNLQFKARGLLGTTIGGYDFEVITSVPLSSIVGYRAPR